MMKRAQFIVPLVLLMTLPALAQNIQLGLPLDCTLRENCWVQQYVDHDPSPAAVDYQGGAETYDKHDGTDIRIRDTATTVKVLASADGVVKALRDGVVDRLMKTESDRAAVQKIECGNGVVIAHAGGWETQYCHMKQGSVLVKKGEAVTAGTPLGDVGYSGMAAFPHVHITVRQNGKMVDPFLPNLWKNEPAYDAGDIIATGFHHDKVDVTQLETGEIRAQNPTSSWPALVAYAWLINLRESDTVTVTLTGPDGITATNSATLERSKAQYMLFAGKKAPADGWPSGAYRGHIEVSGADGKPRLQKVWSYVIP